MNDFCNIQQNYFIFLKNLHKSLKILNNFFNKFIIILLIKTEHHLKALDLI